MCDALNRVPADDGNDVFELTRHDVPDCRGATHVFQEALGGEPAVLVPTENRMQLVIEVHFRALVGSLFVRA
jgi:hypothetical protein